MLAGHLLSSPDGQRCHRSHMTSPGPPPKLEVALREREKFDINIVRSSNSQDQWHGQCTGNDSNHTMHWMKNRGQLTIISFSIGHWDFISYIKPSNSFLGCRIEHNHPLHRLFLFHCPSHVIFSWPSLKPSLLLVLARNSLLEKQTTTPTGRKERDIRPRHHAENFERQGNQYVWIRLPVNYHCETYAQHWLSLRFGSADDKVPARPASNSPTWQNKQRRIDWQHKLDPCRHTRIVNISREGNSYTSFLK